MHTRKTFINEFLEFYMELAVKFKNKFLGDFNIHDVIYFIEMYDAVGLQQHIKQETHISGNKLDLVLNECGNSEKICDVQTGLYLSDHCVVLIALQYPKRTVIAKIMISTLLVILYISLTMDCQQYSMFIDVLCSGINEDTSRLT